MQNIYQIPTKSSSSSERKAFWLRVITDQKSSGMSMAKFCQQNQLKYTTFRGYKYRNDALKCSNTKSFKFIPLQVATDTSQSNKLVDDKAAVSIVFKNGHKLILSSTLTEKSLLFIIKAVAKC